MSRKTGQPRTRAESDRPDNAAIKISTAFMARLAQALPEQPVHAIVILDRTEMGAQANGQRQTREERQSAIETMRQLSARSLGEIDRILTKFNGNRLADHADVLGSIPVEATPPGIFALAESPSVKRILEDQRISLV